MTEWAGARPSHQPRCKVLVRVGDELSIGRVVHRFGAHDPFRELLVVMAFEVGLEMSLGVARPDQKNPVRGMSEQIDDRCEVAVVVLVSVFALAVGVVVRRIRRRRRDLELLALDSIDLGVLRIHPDDIDLHWRLPYL